MAASMPFSLYNVRTSAVLRQIGSGYLRRIAELLSRLIAIPHTSISASVVSAVSDRYCERFLGLHFGPAACGPVRIAALARSCAYDATAYSRKATARVDFSACYVMRPTDET
eukprot:6179545-Pleurochrysis_carterae.AAC.1